MNKYAVSVTLALQNETKKISIANYLDVIEADSEEFAIAIGIVEAAELRPGYEVVSYQAREIFPETAVLILG